MFLIKNVTKTFCALLLRFCDVFIKNIFLLFCAFFDYFCAFYVRTDMYVIPLKKQTHLRNHKKVKILRRKSISLGQLIAADGGFWEYVKTNSMIGK